MSRLKKKKEVTEFKEVTVGYKCDCCGKITNSGINPPDDWHSFHSRHEAWGNDSIDSFEYFNTCSPECFIKTLSKELIELEPYANDGAEIANMTFAFANNLVKFTTSRF